MFFGLMSPTSPILWHQPVVRQLQLREYGDSLFTRARGTNENTSFVIRVFVYYPARSHNRCSRNRHRLGIRTFQSPTPTVCMRPTRLPTPVSVIDPYKQPIAWRDQARQSGAWRSESAVQRPTAGAWSRFSRLIQRQLPVVSVGSNSVTLIDTATNAVKGDNLCGKSPHEAFFHA